MKPTEVRETVDGNDYNSDLHKKPTENLQQLKERFTKRLKEVSPENTETKAYLLGCIDVVEYLATGKLPSDGNHDGMKSHKPRNSALQFKEKVNFDSRYV